MPRVAEQREAVKTPPASNGATKTTDTNNAKKAKDDASASITFAQRLAHSDLSIRTANLKRLSSFLHRRSPITPTDLQKIYKGLFYLFWLSDKPLVQQQMAERLAGMQDGMREVRWMVVVRGFWVMIRREWTGIDRLRLDKYMTWVRCMLAHSLRYLGKRRWEEGMVGQWMDMMTELPLANNQEQRGLFLHVADIFVTELGRVLEEDEVGEMAWAVVERMLQPFWDVVSTCPDASMVKRVEEEVLEALYNLAAEEEADGRSALHGLMKTNADKMAEKLFTLASDKSTLNKYRTRLYRLRDMWHSLQRKEEARQSKQQAADSEPAVGKKRKGEETVTQSVKKTKKRKSAADEDEDEVPLLVELDESGQAKPNDTAALKSKKRKAEVVGDGSSQKQKQSERTKQSTAKVTESNNQTHAVKLDKKAANGSVFADAAEFEVPEFGYDEEAEQEGSEVEDDEGEEGEAEGEDDMGAILRAEEENDGEDDNFAQEDDVDAGEEELDVDGDGKEQEEKEEEEEQRVDMVDAADDGLFMDSDAFERAIAQEETTNRKGKTTKQPAAAQPPSKTEGKRVADEEVRATRSQTTAGKKSDNSNGALNGHAEKESRGRKQQPKAVEESKEQEEADEEAEAEKQAEAEMEQQQPQKTKARKQKQSAGKAEVAAEDQQQQNGKRKTTKQTATSKEEKAAVETPNESAIRPMSKSTSKKQKQAAHEEKDENAPSQQTGTEEEKQSATSTSTSSSPFVTPRSRNKSRSTSSPSNVATAVTATTTTTTTTTTATITTSSSTPLASSPTTAVSAVLASTPLTSRTPKRVSISLEHNRVQQFHHWKPLQVKADDTPPSSRTAPKSALKRNSMRGEDESDNESIMARRARMSWPDVASNRPGDASGRWIGSPRRPTAADFF